MLTPRQRILLRIRYLMQQQRSLDELQRLPDPRAAYLALLRDIRTQPVPRNGEKATSAP